MPGKNNSTDIPSKKTSNPTEQPRTDIIANDVSSKRQKRTLAKLPSEEPQTPKQRKKNAPAKEELPLFACTLDSLDATGDDLLSGLEPLIEPSASLESDDADAAPLIEINGEFLEAEAPPPPKPKAKAPSKAKSTSGKKAAAKSKATDVSKAKGNKDVPACASQGSPFPLPTVPEAEAQGAPASDAQSSSKPSVHPDEKEQRTKAEVSFKDQGPPSFGDTSAFKMYLNDGMGNPVTQLPMPTIVPTTVWLNVEAVIPGSAKGPLCFCFTLPSRIEPAFDMMSQLELNLLVNGQHGEAGAAFDWTQSKGKLFLTTAHSPAPGMRLDIALPLRMNPSSLVPRKDLLIYGEAICGKETVQLPLLTLEPPSEVQAKALCSAAFLDALNKTRDLSLRDHGSFTLQLSVLVAHATANIHVEIPLVEGIRPRMAANMPTFRGFVNGQSLSARTGLWEGLYTPSTGASFLFYAIEPGQRLLLELPFEAYKNVLAHKDGIEMTPVIRIGDVQQAVQPLKVYVRPSAILADAPSLSDKKVFSYYPAAL